MKSLSPKKMQEPRRNSRQTAERMRSMISKKNQYKGSQKIAKKLEFGHVHAWSYSHHTTQVKDIFWNANLNWFVSYDEKNLHVWDSTNGRMLFMINFFDTAKSHIVSWVAYWKRYHLYLAATTDFKLLVYNENLKFIGSLDLKVRLISSIYFWEEESKI